MNKLMIVIELILVMSIVSLFFVSKPEAVYPTNGMVVSDNFDFDYDNGKVILASDKNFENIVDIGGEKIELLPGTYYWKVKYWFRESEIKNFTVESKIELELKKIGEDYELQNRGNVDLNVSEYNKEGITGQMILEIGESKELEDIENKTYEGNQDE